MLSKTMSKVRGLALAAVLVATVVTSTGSVLAAGSTDPNTLIISGSTTVYPIMALAVTRFPGSPTGGVPGAILTVAQGGSGKGQQDLSNGIDDVAMSSSSCNDSNMTGTYKCADVDSTPIARDAISIIVNNTLPAGCTPAYLTKQDIINIWGNNGSVNAVNFNDLSQVVTGTGAGQCPAGTAMHIYAREIGSGTRASLIDINKSGPTGGLTEAVEQAKVQTANRRNGNPLVEAAVDGDQYGIGYVGLHFVGGNNHAIAIDNASYGKSTASPCSARTMPGEQAVLDNCYGLGRTLYLMTLKSSINGKALIQSLLSWFNTTDAQWVVKYEEYVPLTEYWNPADVNLDGTMNTGDVVGIGSPTVWGKTYSLGYAVRADCNGDGNVNTGDVVQVGLTSNWTKASHPYTMP